tara:strand:- start:10140 stop:10487 length:348 start_codon:yes stop_codon:yes gene_type:complete
MPYGEGTYGSKVGRPKKKKRTTVKKGSLPKAKTNLKGTTADKIISPTVKGVKQSAKAAKEAGKKGFKKASRTVSDMQTLLQSGAKKIKKGMKKTKTVAPRTQKRVYSNNTYVEGK